MLKRGLFIFSFRRTQLVACAVLIVGTAVGLTACRPSTPADKRTSSADHPPSPSETPAEPAPSETPAKFDSITQARIEKGYAVVVFKDGRKRMFPFSELQNAEREWLTEFAAAHPFAHGKSTITVTRAEVKKTIARQTHEGTTEVVQLCPPAIMRDQIGSTCALYARVHFLDIAGYRMSFTPSRDSRLSRSCKKALIRP